MPQNIRCPTLEWLFWITLAWSQKDVSINPVPQKLKLFAKISKVFLFLMMLEVSM